MQVNRIIIDKDALQNRYIGRLGMLDLEDLVIRGRADVKNVGALIVSQPCGSHDERSRIESKPVAVSNLGYAMHCDGARSYRHVEAYDGAIQHVGNKYLGLIEIIVDGQIPGTIHICVFEDNGSLFIKKQERTRSRRTIVVRQLADHNKPTLQRAKCCRQAAVCRGHESSREERGNFAVRRHSYNGSSSSLDIAAWRSGGVIGCVIEV